MFAAVFGGNKYEDAAELVEKACNNYKLAKMWPKSRRPRAAGGLPFEERRQTRRRVRDGGRGEREQEGERGRRDREPEASNGVLQRHGRLSIAAKHLKDIGDISEKEGKMEVALQAYTEAGDLYAGEESSSTANACL